MFSCLYNLYSLPCWYKFSILKPVKLSIQIKLSGETEIECLVSDDSEKVSLKYALLDRNIDLSEENQLAKTIRTNHHQFEKVIRSAIKGKIRPGQTISCVFIEDFPFLKESDFQQYIRVDRRLDNLKISIHNNPTKNIHQVFADGSFAEKTGLAAFGGFTESPDGKREAYQRSFEGGSNNMMELLAVSEGLERLKIVDVIRVNTDSRFVIRGLVQWVHFWRHNNWQTAYGSTVKFAGQWQHIDALCENKIIEFRWIKGHAGHEAHTICHDLAKQSSKKS